MLNVLDYGADPSGVADSGPAIVAAHSAALAAGGNVVYLPAGTYRTTAPLALNPYWVTIRGDGPQLSIIKPELVAGQYALTLSWSAGEPSGKSGPFPALEGVALVAPSGAGQPNGILIGGDHAHSMTLRDVSIVGFETQVDLGDHCYLMRFDRVFFTSSNLYAVRMDLPTGSGENISFAGCVFSGGQGTGIYLNKSGATFQFDRCSFDYMIRVIWQRAGFTAFTACHFETGSAQGAPGREYLLLDRRGSVSLPMMNLTDCDLYTLPSTFDTFIRTKGDNGDQILRIVNLYAGIDAVGCPYLVRDDGPFHSNITVVGMGYVRGDVPALKLKRQNGTEIFLTPPTSM